MSADRWSRCPKCLADFRLALIGYEQLVEAAYGKVPHAEWESLKAAIPTIPGETLRQDWGVYLNENDGKFSFDFGASCEECGFEYRFKHAENTLRKIHGTQPAV